MYVSKHVFWSEELQEQLGDEAHHFEQNVWKFKDDSKNAIKTGENVSSFPVSSIWIGSGNLSILLREYS